MWKKFHNSSRGSQNIQGVTDYLTKHFWLYFLGHQEDIVFLSSNLEKKLHVWKMYLFFWGLKTASLAI